MGVIEKKAAAFDEMAKFVLSTVDPYWITREAIVRYEQLMHDPTISPAYKDKLDKALVVLRELKRGM